MEKVLANTYWKLNFKILLIRNEDLNSVKRIKLIKQVFKNYVYLLVTVHENLKVIVN